MPSNYHLGRPADQLSIIQYIILIQSTNDLSKGNGCVALVEGEGAECLPALGNQPVRQQDGVGHYHDGEHQEEDVDKYVEVKTELHCGINNV